MATRQDQIDAHHRAHGGRQQDDGRQRLPAQQCAQAGQQFEITLGHALHTAHQLVGEGHCPERKVAKKRTQRGVRQ